MTTLSAPELAVVRGQPILSPRGLFCSKAVRETVYSGRIAGDPFIDGTTLAYHAFFHDGASGTAGDVLDGMSVDFGMAAGGRELGTSRVRKAPVSTVFFVAETPPALLPLVDDAYFTVKREFRPWLRLPIGVQVVGSNGQVSSISMLRDYDQSYVDQNLLFVPKANITRSATSRQSPKPAGFVDNFLTASPLAYRTMVLSGAFSFTFSTGGSIASYLWDVRDGTITVGTSASATITVRFPQGFRYISLTVTDSEGKIGIMHFPIWVHDAANMPLSNFSVERCVHGDYSEVELDFFAQDTSETVIPKGTALCFWEFDPFWGDTIPDQYRDQTLGWCKEDTTLFRKYQARNTLTITGLGEWMNRFRAIPQRIYNPLRAAVTWFEMQNIYLDKLVYFMFHNFSTGSLIGNLFTSGVTDAVKALDITGDSLFGQIKYIPQGYYGRARFDPLNGLWLRRHYSYMTSAERAAVDTVIGLTNADWPDEGGLKLLRRQHKVVASLLGAGASFDGADNTVFNARAPGRTPAESNVEQDAPGQNLPYVAGANTNTSVGGAQDALNHLTGAHYAYLNNERENVSLELLPNLDVVDPAWGEPISITSSDSDSGLDLAGDLFLVKEVSVSYEDPYSGRGKRVSWSLEGVTTGVDAQMVEVVEDDSDPEDLELPAEIVVAPVVPTTIIPVSGVAPSEILEFTANAAECILRRDFVPGVGYATVLDKSTGLISPVTKYHSNNFDYDAGFGYNTEGANYASNIGNASFSGWANRKTLTQMFGAAAGLVCAHGDHKRNGWAMACADNGYRSVTTDGWQTCTPLAGSFETFMVAPHDANVVFGVKVDIRDVGGWNGVFTQVHKSTDGGMTFSLHWEDPNYFALLGQISGWFHSIDIPYQNPGGGNNTIAGGLFIRVDRLSWWGGWHGNGAKVRFETNNGGSSFPVSYSTDVNNLGEPAISAHTWNANRIAWHSTTPPYGIAISLDGGTTTLRNVFITGTDGWKLNGWPAIGTDDPDVGWWVTWNPTSGGGGGIAVSFDNGQTWLRFTSDPKNYVEFRLATVQ